MSPTSDVGAVVDALRFSDSRVAAGTAGVRRQVSRARMAGTARELRRVDPNDLVVTTMEALLGTGEEWEHVLARLAAAEVAAVAVRLDPSERLPAALLAAADRLSLPVIAVLDRAPLADVTTAVLEALFEAQGRRLERVLDIDQRFTRIVLDGGGPTEITTTLHELLGCPIAIVDRSGKATLIVPSDATGAVDHATTSTVRQPIVGGGHRYGEIVALTDHGASLDHDQLFALDRASTAISIRFAHASAVAAEHERFAAISLEALVAGHSGDPADVTERAISFGWDLGLPRAVLLASIDPPTDPDTLPPALATIAAAARATLGPDAIVWARSSTIAALVAPETDEPADRRRIAEGLRRELDQRLRSVTVSIGVGRRVDDPGALSRSFFEASRAVDVGRWAKGRHVTEVFDELGLERLLASASTDDLAEFVQQAIGPLVEHDRTEHTDLVETFSVWLDTRNMAEAARRVHVHYNTFKNRLERIEEILGPILSDPARTLECGVAMYVARQYDGPWRLGAGEP